MFDCPARITEESRGARSSDVMLARLPRARLPRLVADRRPARCRRASPNVVEVNPLPGILPNPADNSCFPKAARAAGMSYDELIQSLSAARRGTAGRRAGRRAGDLAGASDASIALAYAALEISERSADMKIVVLFDGMSRRSGKSPDLAILETVEAVEAVLAERWARARAHSGESRRTLGRARAPREVRPRLQPLRGHRRRRRVRAAR